MFCQQCGKEIADGSKFCKFCGADNLPKKEEPEVVNTPEETKKKHQKKEKKEQKEKKKGKKIGLIFLLLLVLVIVCGVYLLFRPEGRFFLNMKLDRFEEAIAIYEEDIEGITTQGAVDSVLVSQIEDIYAQYAKGEIEYTILYNRYESMRKLKSEKVQTALENWQYQADELNLSRTAYETAEQYFNNSEFEKAYPYYLRVIEADGNYEEAQAKALETAEKYKEAILKEVEEYKKTGEYGEAVNRLNQALDILKNDSEFMQELTICENGYADVILKKVLKEAAEKAGEGNYADALSIVGNALKQNSENKEILTAQEKYSTEYVNKIISEIERLLVEDNYEQAILSCEMALKVLPGNEELTVRLGELNENKPVNLNELKISESKHYKCIEGKEVTEDTIGNVYSPGNLFTISGDGYAKYYLAKQYKSLKLKIAILDNTVDPEWYRIETMMSFYDNNKNQIIYTTDYMGKATAPFEVEMDVSGVEWLYITTKGKPGNGANVIPMLINPVLYH